MWGRVADAAEARLGLGFGYNAQSGSRYQELMVTSDSLKWYGSLTRIGNDDRHNYQYWRACGGYRVNWRRETNFSPYIRLGACGFDDAPTDYISDTVAFDMALGFRLWDVAEIEVAQHNSTAGRSDQNEGLDALMISVVLPFN